MPFLSSSCHDSRNIAMACTNSHANIFVVKAVVNLFRFSHWIIVIYLSSDLAHAVSDWAADYFLSIIGPLTLVVSWHG